MNGRPVFLAGVAAIALIGIFATPAPAAGHSGWFGLELTEDSPGTWVYSSWVVRSKFSNPVVSVPYGSTSAYLLWMPTTWFGDPSQTITQTYSGNFDDDQIFLSGELAEVPDWTETYANELFVDPNEGREYLFELAEVGGASNGVVMFLRPEAGCSFTSDFWITGRYAGDQAASYDTITFDVSAQTVPLPSPAWMGALLLATLGALKVRHDRRRARKQALSI